VAILSNKNAVVGWLVLKSGRRVARLYVQDVAPSRRTGGAIAGALGAAAALMIVWRVKRSTGDSPGAE